MVLYKLARNEKSNNGEADKLTCKTFSEGLFSKSNNYETHKLQLSGHFAFLMASYMGRKYLVCYLWSSNTS